jgi:Fe-S-cluster containining protein
MWWEKGIRFQCQGSGRCCVSHGEFGFVYLTLADRRRMAKVLKVTASVFTRKYCKVTDGVHHLNDTGDDCLFLKNKRCTVYEGRPEQCRTWPFWPEVMSAKAWAKEVNAFCPGVDKGSVISAEEIAKTLRHQKKWETDLAGGK